MNKIKILVIVFLALTTIVCLPLIAQAAVGDTFTEGGIEYRVLTETGTTGTLQVGRGSEYSSAISTSTQGILNIPGSVYFGGVSYSVTSIGDYAFNNCAGLTGVTMPDSVTSIGNYTFRNCSGLTSVTIPNSVTSIGDGAFTGCHSLTSVTIPNSVTSIGNYAFSYCSSLTSVTIPESVESIGGGAFALCNNLINIYVNNNPWYLSTGGILFNNTKTLLHSYPSAKGEYYIPNSVTSIGDGAFAGCHSLASVTIPDSVTSIGYEAFMYCSSLTSVTIPDSVAYIGDSAFASCGLTSVTIPESVTSINSMVFLDCMVLKTVSLSAVTVIGLESFGGCTALSDITFGENLQIIRDGAFDNCSALTELTFPASLTYITGSEPKPFSGCNSLSVIYFDGNAPTVTGSSIGTMADAYVYSAAEGFPAENQIWYGLTVKYRDAVAELAIKTPPTLTYAVGGVLDLSALEVTLTYADSTTADVAFANFATYGLTTSLENGTTLAAGHFGTRITITHTASGQTAQTNPLTEYVHLIFDGNGGTNTQTPDNRVVRNNIEINQQTLLLSDYAPTGPEMFTRPGFVFEGWMEEADNSSPTVTSVEIYEADKTVYAKWISEDDVALIFHGNGGFVRRNYAEDTFTKYAPANSGIVALSAYEPTGYDMFWWRGYSFDGWSLTPNGAVITTVNIGAATPVHVYARWVEGDPVTLTFYGNGGTNMLTPNDRVVRYNIEINHILWLSNYEPMGDEVFQRTGYRFAGRGLTADSPIMDITAVVEVLESDVSVYAVWELSFTGITVKTQPALTYAVGDALDLSALVASLVYPDTDAYDIAFADFATYGLTVSLADGAPLTAEHNGTRITITHTDSGYTAQTGPLAVSIPSPTLESIAVTAIPANTSYDEGDALDLTGLAVTATYSDGSSRIVTDYVTAPYEGALLNDVGTQTITVGYVEDDITKLTTFTVTVNAKPVVLDSISVTVMPTKTAYDEGDALDLTGLAVTATYSDGSPNIVTDYATFPLNGAALNNVGSQTVTVSYTEGGVTKIASFTVMVNAKPDPPETTDAEFLLERAAEILRNGLSKENLRLEDNVLILVIDGREFILSTVANNRNMDGEIYLGDGYYLVYDIKGNGSNVKDFKIIRR